MLLCVLWSCGVWRWRWWYIFEVGFWWWWRGVRWLGPTWLRIWHVVLPLATKIWGFFFFFGCVVGLDFLSWSNAVNFWYPIPPRLAQNLIFKFIFFHFYSFSHFFPSPFLVPLRYYHFTFLRKMSSSLVLSSSFCLPSISQRRSLVCGRVRLGQVWPRIALKCISFSMSGNQFFFSLFSYL